MAEIKFGRKQFGKPTPQGVSSMADFFAGLCGIISGFLVSAKFIPQGFSDIASPVLSSLFVPALLYIKRFFGAQIRPGTDIPVGDVSEIKESAIPEK